MRDDDVRERAAFEANELRGLAQQDGAVRETDPATGLGCWRFPRYVCPWCGPGVGVREGCPEPLAVHAVPGET